MSDMSALHKFQAVSKPNFISFEDPLEAYDYICELYDLETQRLQEVCAVLKRAELNNGDVKDIKKIKGFYPCLRIPVDEDHVNLDPALSHGCFKEPGLYELVLSDPRQMNDFLRQLQLLAENSPEGLTFEIGLSDEEIPFHYAQRKLNFDLTREFGEKKAQQIRRIVTPRDPLLIGDYVSDKSSRPPERGLLLPYNGQRFDHARSQFFYYTRTPYEALQPFVIFSNYDQYIEDVYKYGLAQIKEPADHSSGQPHVMAVVRSGHTIQNRVEFDPDLYSRLQSPTEMHSTKGAQMAACHILMSDGIGFSIINTGVGGPNAVNIAHLVATKRSQAWLMAGHAAGRSLTQRVGDFLYADDYFLNPMEPNKTGTGLRYDQVKNLTIPTSSEIQRAIKIAVEKYAAESGMELSAEDIYRTAAIVSTDYRFWEMFKQVVENMNSVNAYAVDMETGWLAAKAREQNIAFGAFLKISDLPHEDQPKAPAMTDDFFGDLGSHLGIIISAINEIKKTHIEKLHSRKLRPPGGAFVMQ